jgi:Na+/H+ antiporter NhaD/arsenite permease-like protein
MTAVEIIATLLATVTVSLGLARLGYPRAWHLALPAAAAAAYLLTRGLGLTLTQAVASVAFAFCYALIVSERVHRTSVAVGGAAVVLLLRLVPQHAALHGHGEVAGVDWNTVFLLAGMMIIVNEMRHSGVFEWVAVKCAILAKGQPVLIIIYLSTATAILSAFLDNVTTVLLFAPVTILVCNALRVDAVPYLIATILASNIGGTATLIGDPPNIMIGSAAGLSFANFIKVDTPITLAVLAAFLLTCWLVFRKRLAVTADQRQAILAFDASRTITDVPLLRRTGLVMGLVLVGFCVHGALHLEPATIALAGAAVLLIMRRTDPEPSLREVEWNTLFFYIGLFVMVAALVETGVVGLMARGLIAVTGGDVSGVMPHGQKIALTMGILWFSAVSAALMGNVALIPVMTAIIRDIAFALHPEAQAGDALAALQAPDILPLWWALSLGACFGGNLTLVAAGANVVTAGIADRAGHPIGFVRYLRYGVPIALQGLLLSSVYLWALFLR